MTWLTTKEIKDIGQRETPKESYRGEFHLHLVLAAAIESLTIYSYKSVLDNGTGDVMWDLILFVPISFMFEVIFDGFHYLTHLAMHRIPFFYKNFHKKHHKFRYPSAITSFYQHPVDILVTNTVPLVATVAMLSGLTRFSFYMLCLVSMYKTYIEISGHTGKDFRHTSSFPQCIWLPRALGIELEVNDHDFHHSSSNGCNYSKRFTLWDKVFGTYRYSKKMK